MPIITTYKTDGTKVRKPVGYGGGLCNEATAPYEARDIPGQVKKVETDEAYLPPAVQTTATTQKVGGH